MSIKKRTMMTVLLVILLVSLAATPVLAASETTKEPTAAEERIAMRQAVLDMRIEQLENKLVLMKLTRENQNLRYELRQEIKEQKGSLSREQIDALKELHTEIRAITDELQASRGEIHSILEGLRSGGKPALDEVKAAYEAISAIQLERTGQVTSINDLLRACLDLLAL